jgi:hypothetical protein
VLRVELERRGREIGLQLQIIRNGAVLQPFGHFAPESRARIRVLRDGAARSEVDGNRGAPDLAHTIDYAGAEAAIVDEDDLGLVFIRDGQGKVRDLHRVEAVLAPGSRRRRGPDAG